MRVPGHVGLPGRARICRPVEKTGQTKRSNPVEAPALALIAPFDLHRLHSDRLDTRLSATTVHQLHAVNTILIRFSPEGS